MQAQEDERQENSPELPIITAKAFAYDLAGNQYLKAKFEGQGLQMCRPEIKWAEFARVPNMHKYIVVYTPC